VDEKRILVITYYWPPSGGSGVQRWLKFVKYMPQFGVTPFVFTPENPAFHIRDESLQRDVPPEAEIIRFPIWEPYYMFFRISTMLGGKKRSARPTDFVSSKKDSVFQRLATWLRGNLMIPDPRVFWVKPSVKFLTDFIKDNNIDTIITTGPPHSVHLIGYALKKKNHSIRWMADFRDPWSDWGLLDSLRVGTLARKMHKRLESRVLKTADVVTTITPFYVRRFEHLSGRKVHLLTNGYDETDFANLSPVRTEKFVIRHVGIVNEKCNPRPFMQALKEVMLENPKFSEAAQLDFTGEVHPSFRAFVESDGVLAKKTTFTPSVPHKTLINLYNQSSLLLLVLEGYKDAEGYMPGKLFEYLATGLPILGVGPEGGDAADLLQNTKKGLMITGKDLDKLKKEILACFDKWQFTDLQEKNNLAVSDSAFSRRILTKRLMEILNENY
jgi:glycosyltransferase involved in cell wall biosynthesis